MAKREIENAAPHNSSAENELTGLLQSLHLIASEVADKHALAEIDELSEKIRSRKFYLTVIGLFKRGKSSLINALLKKKLAPVAVTPLTAIVTLFEFNESAGAEVIFTDGRILQIELNAIGQYITEEENPENIKQVSYVKIFDNCPCLKNITLIDTPGLGSAYEHNTQVTQQFIPKIDAAIFVLSADIPISKEEMELLKTLKGSIPEIVFTMNKADLLDDTELQKILTYNTSVISSVIGDTMNEKTIIPVSAKKYFENPASSHNIDALQNYMNRIIIGKRESLQRQSAQKRFGQLIKVTESMLKLRLDILQGPVEELEKKTQAYKLSVATMNKGKHDFQIIINGRIKDLQTRIEERVKSFSDKLEHNLLLELESNSDRIFDKVYQNNIGEVEKEYSDQITCELKKLQSSMADDTRKDFKEILEQYNNGSQSYVREIAHQLKDTLNIDFSDITGTFDLDVYTAFYFRTHTELSIQGSGNKMLYRLLPRNMAKEKLLSQFRKSVKELIVTNSAGIIYDLQYRIQESFRMFNYDLNAHMEELLNAIDKIIIETTELRQKNKSSIDNAVDKLLSQMNTLRNMKQPINVSDNAMEIKQVI